MSAHLQERRWQPRGLQLNHVVLQCDIANCPLRGESRSRMAPELIHVACREDLRQLKGTRRLDPGRSTTDPLPVGSFTSMSLVRTSAFDSIRYRGFISGVPACKPRTSGVRRCSSEIISRLAHALMSKIGALGHFPAARRPMIGSCAPDRPRPCHPPSVGRLHSVSTVPNGGLDHVVQLGGVRPHGSMRRLDQW